MIVGIHGADVPDGAQERQEFYGKVATIDVRSWVIRVEVAS